MNTTGLSRAEIRELVQRSDTRALFELFSTWGIIGLAMGAAVLWPHPLAWFVVVFVLGGRQLALSILMHETSHHSLFRKRAVNEFVGRWLCGAPVAAEFDRYRAHHLVHHSHTGDERDPDLSLVKGFPCTRASLARKFLRDLVGITGVKRLVAIWWMASGRIRYTAANDVVRLPSMPARERAKLATRTLAPTLLAQSVFAACAFLIGHPELYLLWVLAYLSAFSLVLRVRSIAEHACLPSGGARTTHAGWLARLLVAPHFVNHHFEHHLLMSVPCYRLPAMHRALSAQGLGAGRSAGSYLRVLRDVSSA